MNPQFMKKLDYAAQSLITYMMEEKNVVISVFAVPDEEKKTKFPVCLLVRNIPGVPIGQPMTENDVPVEWKGFDVQIGNPMSNEEMKRIVESQEDDDDYGFGGDWWKN